jgi:hypothetical protein
VNIPGVRLAAFFPVAIGIAAKGEAADGKAARGEAAMQQCGEKGNVF